MKLLNSALMHLDIDSRTTIYHKVGKVGPNQKVCDDLCLCLYVE